MTRSLPLISALFLVSAGQAAAQCTYLEILPEPGFQDTVAWGVSADGSVVVGASTFGGPADTRAFRWTAATGAVDLGGAMSGRSEAFGVSADGSVVVGWGELGSGASRAFLWTSSTGMGALGSGFGANSVLRAATADGRVAVGRLDNASASLAGQWSEATGAVQLSHWIDSAGMATGMSEEGTIVGYRYYDLTNFATHAFVRRSTPVGVTYCDDATANSTGCIGQLRASGSTQVSANALRLDATSLPSHVLTLFLAARSSASISFPGGSLGTLCLGGPIGRFLGPGQAQSSGPSGAAVLPLDLTALPTPTGLLAALPGETWYFQAWHRATSAPSSNFTDAVAVTLR